VARKTVRLLTVVFLVTLLASKLMRLLFDVRLTWLYVVGLAVFIVGAIVIALRQRRTASPGPGRQP
jgi:drug/metabolite transporter (DMT)-like permease